MSSAVVTLYHFISYVLPGDGLLKSWTL